ncbi:hypothetical protein M408DRAFT_28825 [Serendipita vermifera MAFF 305830]|uniref:F-box domain-containing protein n=1 Tax=Serendipita vermifera MAFF 305830 TaxID=933852 RepID=A0A0C3ASM3_SERVB|nr:hypothetical protein M408DRAFT_28825 [Serendipita vermifera MAFF 305830]
MEHSSLDPTSNNISTKSVETRRTLLLRELEKAEQLEEKVPAERDKIHRLKQAYNQMINTEPDIGHRKYRDPFQVLPVELWKDIVPMNPDVDELLTLTLVSSRWCHALTSIPVIWTNIVLDACDGDYLAKAITYLNLSRPVVFHLTILLSPDQWGTVAPLFMPDSSRIRSLQIIPPEEGLRESLEIFDHFTVFPALRRVTLPYRNPIHVLSSDPEPKPDPSIFQHVSSLVEVTDFPWTVSALQDQAFSHLETINIRQMDLDTIHALARLRRVKCLFLSQSQEPPPPTDHLPISVRECLPWIRELKYWGLTSDWYTQPFAVFERALLCMGENLTRIFAGPINLYQLPCLLASLHRFPQLRDLELNVDHEFQESDANPTPIPVPSLRKFELSFRPPFNVYSEFMGEEARKEKMRIQRIGFSRFFTSLSTTAPLLEELHLTGGFLVDCALEHTPTFHHLRSFTLNTSAVNFTLSDPLQSNTSHKQTWSLYAPPLDFLDRVHEGSLRYLQVSTWPPRPYSLFTFGTLSEGTRITSPRYSISPKRLLTLTTLALRVDHPLMMDLSMLPVLTTIEFIGDPSATLASDFFEEIILRPNEWPLLEHVVIEGNYMEWDILLLMLQRRNFLANSDVKPIKSIELDSPLPYKLLYPMTQLLKGQRPEVLDLATISIQEIGDRMADLEQSGCKTCIRNFRACTACRADWPQSSTEDDAEQRLEWKYQLPHERVNAKPPIPPEMASWLKGKRERRLYFVRKFNLFRTQTTRALDCRTIDRDTLIYRRVITVTRWSMDGANLIDSLFE